MTTPSPERERLAALLEDALDAPIDARNVYQVMADALLAAGYVHRDEAMEENAVVIGPEQAVVLRIMLPRVRHIMDQCETGALSHLEAWRALVSAAEVKPRPALRRRSASTPHAGGNK